MRVRVRACVRAAACICARSTHAHAGTTRTRSSCSAAKSSSALSGPSPPRLTARRVPLSAAVSIGKPGRYFTFGYNLYSPSENVLFHYYGRCACSLHQRMAALCAPAIAVISVPRLLQARCTSLRRDHGRCQAAAGRALAESRAAHPRWQARPVRQGNVACCVLQVPRFGAIGVLHVAEEGCRAQAAGLHGAGTRARQSLRSLMNMDWGARETSKGVRTTAGRQT